MAVHCERARAFSQGHALLGASSHLTLEGFCTFWLNALLMLHASSADEASLAYPACRWPPRSLGYAGKIRERETNRMGPKSGRSRIPRARPRMGAGPRAMPGSRVGPGPQGPSRRSPTGRMTSGWIPESAVNTFRIPCRTPHGAAQTKALALHVFGKPIP